MIRNVLPAVVLLLIVVALVTDAVERRMDRRDQRTSGWKAPGL